MPESLRELRVMVLDCQAGGATPRYGDLLELGWAVSDASALLHPVRSHWIHPRTERPVPKAVRELTGWSRACLQDALPEAEARATLREEVMAYLGPTSPAPTVIHFARFELPFLHDLAERLDEGLEFPFDTVDLHAVAARLYPDLPRRNIRALAGFLGHAPELVRRAAGHVEATAFIWRALIPELAREGVVTWSDLRLFATDRPKVVRKKGRVYPLEPERRKSLPDRPGVYRFLRRNGDIIYVGKAASLRKRVASHFARGAKPSERNLEMLTQVHDIAPTETPSILEAALLETDEIKRIDPPYNVQLRAGERFAWFAARDRSDATSAPDETHRIGPLPSARALTPLSALIALVDGVAHEPVLLAQALAVPMRELPDPALFEEGYLGFVRDHVPAEGSASRRIDRASRALWLERGRKEPEVVTDETTPLWDLARVRRRLERNLIQSGLLERRARWLSLLADADVGYREADMPYARVLSLSGCEFEARHDLDGLTDMGLLPVRRPRARFERQRSFDAARYDRLRVLATELRRVLDDGGEVALRVGAHVIAGERLQRIMREVY